MPALTPLPDAPRVLVVRTSAIGDIVFATPFAAAIRRHHPGARVAWLAEQGLEPLLVGDPAIDEVIPWPRREWARLWRERRFLALARAVKAFRAQLRVRRFDVAIDLQGLLKSGLLTRLSGAPRRIGLGSREGSQHLVTEVVPKGGRAERFGSEYEDLAQRLGLAGDDDFLPSLPVAASVAAAARDTLVRHGLAPGGYAVFAAFTTRPQKHWFEDAWRELAPTVQRRFGLVPVLLGGPADREAAARIAAPDTGIVDLTGATPLAQAAAIVRDAALVIGVDTGLTHMGIAAGRPTVALFGSTCPYTDTRRANARVVWLGLACSPCRRRPTCGGAFHCLRDIRAERVADEAAAAIAASVSP